MAFGGEYRHGLDAKNRIFIPAKMREGLGQTFHIAKCFHEKCLRIYSAEAWEQFLAPLREKPKSIASKAIRLMCSTMAEVTPDSQGRVVLPTELIKYAEIEKNLVIVGCDEYVEIWSEKLYAELKENEDVAAILAELEALGY